MAGKDPSNRLKKWLSGYKNIELIENPDEDKMAHLIKDAQINILYSFQSTGLKLKLLNSLYTGRHCIVNPPMVAGTGLEEACHVVSTPDQAIRMVNLLMNTPLSSEDQKHRSDVLSAYSTRENAEKIYRLLD